MRLIRWLLIPLLLVAPAQALSVDLDVWGEPLLPDEPVTMAGLVSANCDELIHPINGDLTSGGMRTAYLEFDVPAGLHVTAPSEVHFERTSCLPSDTAVHIPIEVDVVATDILEALQVHHITYTLTWSDGSGSWEKQFIVQMEYLPGFEVRVLDRELKDGPQKQIAYRVEIQNLANGQSKFSFAHPREDLQGDVLAPDVLLLDKAGGTQDTNIVHVTYMTPFENGPNDVTEEFTMQVSQEFAFDPERTGPTETIVLTAETEGVYVPGPGMLWAPALLALALLRRR